MERTLVFISKIAVSVSLIYFIFTKVNSGDITRHFAEVNAGYFLIGTTLVVISLAINTKKWQVLLRHIGVNEDLSVLMKLNLIGMLYAFLPGGQLTGEVVKGYRITKGKEGKTKIVFSQVMDRLISFIAFILFGFFGFMASSPILGPHNSILGFFLLLLAGVACFAIIFLSAGPITFLKKHHMHFLPIGKKYTMRSALGEIVDPIFAYNKAYAALAEAFLYGAIFQALNTGGLYFFALALNMNISFLNLLWINALVNVILVLPITIMGLGLREGSFVYFLAMFGFESSKAVSLSLSFFIVSFVLSMIGGLFDLYELFLARNGNN